MLQRTDPNEARQALRAIPADIPRDEWVRVCMAAQAAGLSGDEVEAWSAEGASYKPQSFRDLWRSIKPDRGIGPGTLFKIASDYGGRPAANSSGNRPIRRAEPPTRQREGVDASIVWNRCKPAPADHPYITEKDGSPDGLRVVPAGDPLQIAGESMVGALAVPVCRSDGTVASVQFIAVGDTAARLKAKDRPNKLNLPDARLEGWFVVGDLEPDATAYLCEGIGQAWAAHKATGAAAVVCFGAGRFRAVGVGLRAAYPSASLVLLPDVGKEDSADRAAQEVGAAVVRMPDGWPDNSDVNDLAKREGVEALRTLLTTAKRPEPRYRLLGSEDLANLPPLTWRVRGVLPAEGVAALYGPSASGKSFLALDLAAAVAGGARWFDHRTEAAPVVYAALEGEAGFKLRVQAWESHRGRKLPRGMRLMLQPFKVTDPQDLSDLAAVVPAGAVVFLDTLNRAAPTADENSSKDMGEILESVKALQGQTGGLVVLVHHTGKDAAKGLRGHSSLFAAMDAAIEVSRDGDRREWRVAKAKDGQDGDAHPFRLQVEMLGADDYGDAVTSCVVVADTTTQDVRRVKLPQGGNQRAAYEAIRPLFKDGEVGKPGAPAMARCITLEAAIAKAAGAMVVDAFRKTTRAREAISGLCNRGVLGISEGWLWLTA